MKSVKAQLNFYSKQQNILNQTQQIFLCLLIISKMYLNLNITFNYKSNCFPNLAIQTNRIESQKQSGFDNIKTNHHAKFNYKYYKNPIFLSISLRP